MAIIASTQQGPPTSTGCVSPANTSALLVDKATTAQQANVFSITYLDTITTAGGGMILSSIPLDKNIRMTNNGILKTLATVQSDNGVADPPAGAGNQSLVTCNAYQCDVKRPNCECTTLDSFYVYKSDDENSSWVNKLTFSDGYEIQLGVAITFLKIGHSGIEFSAPSVGDWVCTCQSPGRTSDITTGCIQIIAKSNPTIPQNYVQAALPTTSWPQDKFASSPIRGAFMLENGVYIFFIPAGGTYV